MKYRLREKFKNTKLSGKMMLVYIFFAGISCCISIVALQASLKYTIKSCTKNHFRS